MSLHNITMPIFKIFIIWSFWLLSKIEAKSLQRTKRGAGDFGGEDGNLEHHDWFIIGIFVLIIVIGCCKCCRKAVKEDNEASAKIPPNCTERQNQKDQVMEDSHNEPKEDPTPFKRVDNVLKTEYRTTV